MMRIVYLDDKAGHRRRRYLNEAKNLRKKPACSRSKKTVRKALDVKNSDQFAKSGGSRERAERAKRNAEMDRIRSRTKMGGKPSHP